MDIRMVEIFCCGRSLTVNFVTKHYNIMAVHNYFLYGSVLSVNFISFHCGATFSWSSPVISILRSNDNNVNPVGRPVTILEETWIASIFLIGCFITALISSIFSEKFGRKKTLIGFSVFLLISYLICISSSKIIYFLIARIIMGFGTGGILSTLPSYVGEIAEDSIRGVTGALFGIMFSIGHLVNYGAGPFISFRMLNILHVIPLILFYISFIPFVPESPYYFISSNNIEEAKRSLKKLRSNSSIGKELEIIKNSIEESQKNKASLKNMFKSKVARKGLIIACGLMGLQQLSGVRAVQAYLQPIFDESDGFIPAKFSVLIIGIVPLIGNITASFIIDRLGRKVLLITSSAGSAVALLFLGAYFFLLNNKYDISSVNWLPIVSTVCFIFCVHCGLTSIPWLINAEVFSSDVKSIANSLTTSFNILLTFVAVSVFPYMSLYLGMAGALWVFVGFSVFGILFIIFLVPETKGRSFQEIQELLIRRGDR